MFDAALRLVKKRFEKKAEKEKERFCIWAKIGIVSKQRLAYLHLSSSIKTKLIYTKHANTTWTSIDSSILYFLKSHQIKRNKNKIKLDLALLVYLQTNNRWCPNCSHLNTWLLYNNRNNNNKNSNPISLEINRLYLGRVYKLKFQILFACLFPLVSTVMIDALLAFHSSFLSSTACDLMYTWEGIFPYLNVQ